MPYGPNEYIPSGGYGTAAPAAKVSTPPVSKVRQDFVTTDEQEDRFRKAMVKAKKRAMAAAAAKRKKQQRQRGFLGTLQNQPGQWSGQGAWGSSPGFGPGSQTAMPPIVNPYQAVLAAIQGNVQGGQQALAGEYKEAQKSLKNLGAGGAPAGAGLSEVYSAGQSNLANTGTDLKNSISSEAAQFILQQMAQRARQQQEMMLDPGMVRQLVAAGIDPNTISDPFQAAVALGQADRLGTGGSQPLTRGEIVQLAEAGIDYKLYLEDPDAARVKLGKSRRKSKPSKAEVEAILKAGTG